MVPPELREEPHLSYTQLDQYLRCPLKYKLQYVDRLPPAFVPAALAFGSGIHGAAAFFYRGVQAGTVPAVGDVQGYFASLWALEAEHRPVRFGEREAKDGLLDLGTRMLAVLVAAHDPTTTVLAVEEAFRVPLIDPETGEVLARDLVGSLDRLERDAAGRVTVVDLKTAARRYTDLQVDASLQLSVYSYATAMNGLGDQEALRLRFDVLTKTKVPELHRYETMRDAGATRRLYRLAAEVLHAIEAEVFPPRVRWGCQDCAWRGDCWAWG